MVRSPSTSSPNSRTALERLALGIGYAILSLAGLGLLVTVAPRLIRIVLEIGVLMIIAPLVIIAGFLGAVAAASLLALPLLPFVGRDRWSNIVEKLTVVMWVLLGIWVTLS